MAAECPKRIQRLRTRGWRAPEGAIYVGRPTIWGNPFWHTQKFHGSELSLALYRNAVLGIWEPKLASGIHNPLIPYEDFREWMKRMNAHPLEAARSFLKGHDLICWCALDKPCHADILLELANG